MASNKPQEAKLSDSKEVQLKAYEKQVKDNISSMIENFTEIIKQAKIADGTQVKQTTEGEQVHYEVSVRAANVVRAGESLMKLVSDLKQFLILNDFSSISASTVTSRVKYKNSAEENDKKLLALRDEIASELFLLEDEFFNSAVK
ncbi:mediator of RNA polymerase II transcription subunit 22-like [Watersipora subatra]|uniref:mediator of RNA polymerase II transcription subunit 22-like n=1 Tax=Watersipora subatra TaxID=2589382 RepID=UPI00355AF931